MQEVTVIGAGLAGCEAAWQLANRDIKVKLYEQKPYKKSAAHHSDMFAELVCSNSLKANSLDNACGLLKQEMRILGSLTMLAAEKCAVPAGGALAVDRNEFAKYITDMISCHKNIEVINEEVEKIPKDGVVIVATGPLTSDALANNIKEYFGSNTLSFFDAAAPIVEFDSVDMSQAYFAARYDKGSADYINCKMNKEQYDVFYNELINAQSAELKDFDKENLKVFEGCMPIEVMAKRGEKTLLFGPLRPVGLRDPETGNIPYAVVQLRKENVQASLYNLVGFQTNLKFSEQKRVFSLIPALKNASFVRYGVMHTNTFINSPKVLSEFYNTKKRAELFFAGQITGVEGYVESASSGIMAGINAARLISQKPLISFDNSTATGALTSYISCENENFQPMNINFGIIKSADIRIKNKKERYLYIAQNALSTLKNKLASEGEPYENNC